MQIRPNRGNQQDVSSDHSEDPLLPLVTAVENVSGRRVALSTALRWATTGIAGVRLETWRLGGRRCTRASAVRAFIASTTAASDPSIQSPPCPNRRDTAAHDAAMRRLESEGL